MVRSTGRAVTQLCLTLCDPKDCSPPGSSVHGSLQGRVLQWVACPPPGDLVLPGVLATAGARATSTAASLLLLSLHQRPLLAEPNRALLAQGSENGSLHSPNRVFLPGDSQGRRNLVGCRLWDHTVSDTTEVI